MREGRREGRREGVLPVRSLLQGFLGAAGPIFGVGGLLHLVAAGRPTVNGGGGGAGGGGREGGRGDGCGETSRSTVGGGEARCAVNEGGGEEGGEGLRGRGGGREGGREKRTV